MKYLYLIAMFLLNNALIADDGIIIFDTNTGERITVNEMANRASSAQVVFFGEFHDDSLNHVLQDMFFRKFYELNNNLALSLEMFERDVQSLLDSYLKGEIKEEEFLKNSRPWGDYKKFYRSMVEFSKEKNLPVLASNIPRKYAAMYAQGGMTRLDTIPAEERNYITRKMVLEENDYLEKFFLTMLGSKEKIANLTSNQENSLYLFYGAQCIKDETMAESIYDFLKLNPNHKVVHLNGDFHSNSYLGTVEKLLRRNNNISVSVITPLYYDKIEDAKFDVELSKQGDFVIYLPNFPRPPQPMMRGTHLSENFAIAHNIDIEISPISSSVKGLDTVTFRNPILKSGSLKLLNSLKIDAVEAIGGDIDWEIRKSDDYYNEIIIHNKTLKNQSYTNDGIIEFSQVIVYYSGVVNFPPSETNLVKRHSNSAGIISSKEGEGIYLPGGSFYPQTDKDLAKFNMAISIDADFTIITSGDIVAKEIDGKKIYRVETTELNDITIVGGRYKSLVKSFDGIEFGIYMLKDNPNAERYLNESIEYYKLYTNLFGKYPYNSFNIVENFFATGFGMPGYTLLSNRLTAMPWVLLSPGSLAHEFVHNWWGNSVFVDYNMGNWCEALTTFSTNYYYNTLASNHSAAKDWRRKALLSIESLPDDKNYPVQEFKYQRNTYDAVIGYDKGSFIFQEIIKLTGEELFFNALKTFAEKYRGKRAFWMNLTAEFANATKEIPDLNIRNVMNDWLRSTDVPNLSFEYTYRRDSVRVVIYSDIKRKMSVPVSFSFKNEADNLKHYFVINDTINEFTISVPRKPRNVELDPDIEALRKLYRHEKPFSLSRTLSSEPIIVVPSEKSPDFAIAMQYVKLLNESVYNFEVRNADDLTRSEATNNSLILLGSIKSNKIISNYAKQMPDGTKLNKHGFHYDGGVATFEKEIMIANVEHMRNPDKLCTIIYFDNIADVSPLGRLIHYRSQSLVLLSSERSGRPVYQQEVYPKK